MLWGPPPPFLWRELKANQVAHPLELLGGRSAGLITMRGGACMSMQKINDPRAPNHKKILNTSGSSPTSLTQETVISAGAIRTDRAETADWRDLQNFSLIAIPLR